MLHTLADRAKAGLESLAHSTPSGVARGAVNALHRLDDTGIFQNVPIVSNILSAATVLNGIVEGHTASSEALSKLQSLLSQVEPVLINLFSRDADHDALLAGIGPTLKEMESTIKQLHSNAEAYISKGAVLQHAEAASDLETFSSDFSLLQSQIASLNLALTSQVFKGVASIGTRLDRVLSAHEEQHHRLDASKARSDIVEQLEIDSMEVDIYHDELVGAGSSAKVYRAAVRGKRSWVAKIFDLSHRTITERKAVEESFKKELAVMYSLRHECVVAILGAITSKPLELVLLMEFVEGGALRHVLESQYDCLSSDSKARIAYDICAGMTYLYGLPSPVQHRDLKSLNVLLDRNCRAKVTDFGVSKSSVTLSFASSGGSRCGTTQWSAPEWLHHALFSEKADVFSFGITLWEILTGKLPHEGKNESQIITAVLIDNKRPEPMPETKDETFEGECAKLMVAAWNQDPNARPTFKDIMKELRKVVSKEALAGRQRIKNKILFPQESCVLDDDEPDDRPSSSRKLPTSPSGDRPTSATKLRTEVEGARWRLNSTYLDAVNDDLWFDLAAQAGDRELETILISDFIVAFEVMFVEGGDLPEDRKNAFIAALDLNKNGRITRGEFSKFCAKWKKSEIAAVGEYLDSVHAALNVDNKTPVRPDSKKPEGSRPVVPSPRLQSPFNQGKPPSSSPPQQPPSPRPLHLASSPTAAVAKSLPQKISVVFYSVKVGGVTEKMTPSADYVDAINGIYQPTEQIVCGMPVYQHSADEEIVMSYYSEKREWQIQTVGSVGTGGCMCSCPCKIGDPPYLAPPGSWMVANASEFQAQPDVTMSVVLSSVVWISGAEAHMCPSAAHAEAINGTFAATDEEFGGISAFQSQQRSDVWLVYYEKNGDWQIQTEALRGTGKCFAYVSAPPFTPPDKVPPGTWKITRDGSFNLQPNIEVTLIEN